jgi:hypothetical protein
MAFSEKKSTQNEKDLFYFLLRESVVKFNRTKTLLSRKIRRFTVIYFEVLMAAEVMNGRKTEKPVRLRRVKFAKDSDFVPISDIGATPDKSAG